MLSAELVAFRIAKKLAPAQAGAKRLAARYGESPVGMRYRVDDTNGRRYTTVELVVDVRTPPVPADKAIMGVRISFGETELRAKVKAAGGRWDAASCVWRVERHMAKKLRIVSEMNLNA